ncbi:GMC family oxidoreductase [Niabella hibiscisoli]|uniref:GMC family oxidoreductase n=1 Tax=Niabella hibiscisoli TaxID=1825928 RepID=UPI00293EC0E4|nr:GMC family oxidoreductase [Niabella hibiscisoli]
MNDVLVNDSKNINTNGKATHTYDAIVVGSGISGGWAAKELCDKGLKTLVLERGRDVQHLKDYPTMNLRRWELPHSGSITLQQKVNNPLISKAAGYDEATQHFFVKDEEHPYIQEKPFDWIRGYQVGGKSLTWGRSCQRWSDWDFSAPLRYGYAVDWPVRYNDIAPWYSYVEQFIGVCGSRENIESMPDGEFLPPMEFNCVEEHFKKVIWDQYQRNYIPGRLAHITEPKEIHGQQGRAQCQNRDLCMRGCPFGGYFSSNASTLPWANRTGNLTLRPHSVVHSVIYDEQKQKATGVRVIDALTKETTEYFADIIFINASALNTNLILLNSTSTRFPNGLGNDNGLMGKYICFHNYRGSMNATFEGMEDQYYKVRRATECVIPNFRNLKKLEADFLGGYVIFSGGYRSNKIYSTAAGIGAAFKEELSEPGAWGMYMYMQGETIPKASNHVRLSDTEKDRFGMPLLITSVGYDENDDKMVHDFLEQGQAMFKSAGGVNIQVNDSRSHRDWIFMRWVAYAWDMILKLRC